MWRTGCRKGNRECVYPEPASSKSGRSAKSKASPESGESQDDGDCETKDKEKLPPIPDGDEESAEPTAADPDAQELSIGQGSQRGGSSTPSLTLDKSPSPSGEGSISSTQPSTTRPTPSRRGSRQTLKRPSPARSWETLPAQLRFYLEYHRNYITCHHYSLKHDGSDWLSTTFLEIAVRNPPLLYAVVGFAAYHSTMPKQDGKMSDFLQYYNQSVKLLRQSIERKQRHNIATLLTILQLANIEVG
jgi:hypothetical protein